VKPRLEADMVEPLRVLMRDGLHLDVVAEEFSAGYGIADLVGAAICKRSCRTRRGSGMCTPLDDLPLLEVLLSLTPGLRRSLGYVQSRLSFSESTLRQKVLPQLARDGLIERDHDGYVRLVKLPPQPTKHIVAVELKRTRWRQAIIQARRYTYFADQTYVALWNGTAPRVDRRLLYKHRLGLIAVEGNSAEILLEAPRRKPRDAKMNRYCAEFLYRQALASSS
jgi:hypothetical protein